MAPTRAGSFESLSRVVVTKRPRGTLTPLARLTLSRGCRLSSRRKNGLKSLRRNNANAIVFAQDQQLASLPDDIIFQSDNTLHHICLL
jgi:hypothetical protein